MRILLAEDEDRLRKNMERMLQKENYTVVAVDNGEAALDEAQFCPFDLVILDWMMPNMSGIDVCIELRKIGFEGSILIVTARDDSEDIVKGLDSGADDYIVKPFKMNELLARVRALLRRMPKTIEQTITVGHLTLHKDRRVVMRDGQELDLTKNEFLLVEYLFLNKGVVLTREQIFDYIWGIEQDVSNNALDALIKLVRKKIDEPCEPSYIQNIRGLGYKLRDVHV